MSAKNVLILSALLLWLFGYTIAAFYTFPFADDFCFGWTASESISLTQKFLNQYLYWNGRYTSDILIQFNPLLSGSLLVYHLCLVAALLALPLALLFLLLQVSSAACHALFASLALTFYYYAYMPDITEELYWFTGSLNYQWAHVALCLQLAFFLKAKNNLNRVNKTYAISSLLLLIFTAGFNELAALGLFVFYGAQALHFFIAQKRINRFLAIHAFLALLCLAVVMFAPGNALRAENFPEKHQLFYSLGYASLQTIRFMATWIFTVPFITGSLLLILHASAIKESLRFSFHPRIAAVSALIIVFAGAFVPYYATGLLGQHRTINFVMLPFLILYAITVVQFSRKFALDKKLLAIKPSVQYVLIALALLSACFTGNGAKLLTDFYQNSLHLYEGECISRQQIIIRNGNNTIRPIARLPLLFKIADVKGDSEYWTDKCMANFYSETGIELK